VTYRIRLETRARREYRDLPDRIRGLIADVIDDLQADPRPPGCRKLGGGNGYRVRTGDYRVLYAIDDASGLVRIYRIGHRSTVYRRR
jgi:mRNA interferase RelE/StbE